MADPLFPVHNAFHIGAYQAAINEAQGLSGGLSDTEATERDCYVHRAYIAQGQYGIVEAEITDSAPTALQSVKLLAQYLSSPAQKESAVAALGELLEDPSCSSNPTLLLMAATVYAHEGRHSDALRCCHSGGGLEHLALMVQLLVGMHRPDAAEKTLRQMSALDDDHTLTQLATAWVNVGVGGAKLQEAFYVFQELGDKYSWTVKLFGGSAACHMAMGQYEDAEKDLLEALNKDPKDADTLAALAVCSHHLSKPAGRYLAQLKAVAPGHPTLAAAAAAEEDFERAASSFS
mmetsp:Transcript_17989/g.61295  ORF Transcript_17989/g.61295 Transcript_17989/m.61295 type:complete len:290 (-) Transcript_17989:228-1097(-)